MLGFVDQFSSDLHSQVLSQSWVLVNTATREAMPNSMLEAAAHGCAMLSYVDPDGFASNFGYHASKDDFASGLEWLLKNDRWRERGDAARAYTSATFETSRALDLHESIYRDLLELGPGRGRSQKPHDQATISQLSVKV